MADFRSPLTPFNGNRNTPSLSERHRENTLSSKHALSHQDENRPFDSPSGPPSSPFVADINISPSKAQTPAKIRSPLKEAKSYEPRCLTEEALQENDVLSRGTKSLHEAKSDPSKLDLIENDAISIVGGVPGFAGMDDTCFSAFSAVPNADMTQFANLGQSPTKSTTRSPMKRYGEEGLTPRPKSRSTPSRNTEYHNDDNASPTPRRHKSQRDDDTTNLLVDFADQFSLTHTSRRSPERHDRLSPTKSQSHKDLSSYVSSRRTPSPAKYPLPPGTPSEARHFAHLLDFDLPPPPTPRSVPSISARELESMKSNFLSQISSLTARLSGSEAEVKALSSAVTDAERRVGEALEEVRNERGAKEGLQAERDDLEKRQKEMQSVLKEVKEEIIRGDREKDTLLQRAQEAEHKREEAESKVVEAESKLEGLKNRSPSSSTPPSSENGTNSNAEVEAAVTKVAKELHGLYKSKHEAKVTMLKKSYSDRWEKKVRDLHSKVEELGKENEDLRVARDATMSGVVPGTLISGAEDQARKAELEEFKQQCDEQKHKIDELDNELVKVQQELVFTKNENKTLHVQLSASRTEIDDLISATEELMQLSQSAISASSENQLVSNSQEIRSTVNRSVSGPSGLKAPGFGGGAYSGESRIGRIGAGYGGSFSRERSGSGLGSRSGIMSNIEMMGRRRVID
ncbi:MAG: hypothetical protein Q9164_000668 [Protoblastenia rupestris]